MLCKLISRPAHINEHIQHYGIWLQKLTNKNIERLPKDKISIMTQFGSCVFQLGKSSNNTLQDYSIVSLKDFSDIEIDLRNPSSIDARTVITRICTQIQERPSYSLLCNNCEHAARYIFEEKHYSTQIDLLNTAIEALVEISSVASTVISIENQTKIISSKNLNST